MFISRKEYERLCEENSRLREKYEDLRFKLSETSKQYIDIWTQHCSNFLDDYEYAVLLPKGDYVLKVWNDGRFEEKVREIEVSQEEGFIPHFRIEK